MAKSPALQPHRAVLFLAIAGCFISFRARCAEIPPLPETAQKLLAQAKQAKPARVEYAKKARAEIWPSFDGKTFVLVWKPVEKPKGWIVTLHGHDAWAFDSFSLWHPHLKSKEIGVVAVQWWFGKGEGIEDYCSYRDLYRIIDETLEREDATPGTVLLHGFSRGSANTYAVAGMDCGRPQRWFGLVLSDSGGYQADYPPNRELFGGAERDVLKGMRWATYAGARDTTPDRDGIPGMRRTADWLKGEGAEVVLQIEDPNAGHGGFFQGVGHVDSLLDLFEKQIDAAGR